MGWGSISYTIEKGRKRQAWALVMVLSRSRSICLEFVRTAGTACFNQCYINAFAYLNGAPRRCLYDNVKVVTLGKDAQARTDCNRRMLDFAGEWAVFGDTGVRWEASAPSGSLASLS